MNDWQGRRVAVIGAARQGLALARYLVEHGAQLVINDRRPAGELQTAVATLSDLPAGSVEWVFDGHPFEVLEGADTVCPSGGVSLQLPLIQEALKRGILLSNDSQIFLEAVPCMVVGITGSAGKTTTTTLLGRMAYEACKLKGEGRQVWVGGNIGVPLIASVDQMKPGDLAVMELSSFQLEIMTRSPQVAAVLNVTPNHLDRHANMDEYTAVKKRILDFQAPGDVAVLGRDDPGAWNLAKDVHGRLVSFGLQPPGSGQSGTYMRDDRLYLQEGFTEVCLMARSDILLRGEHNVLNVLAACAIAAAIGFPVESMRAGVNGFLGVPHRLELVREWKGARWYNDSIATAPERTIAAIYSFDEPLVLLAGGRDKNLPWEEFATLARQRVDHLILFGEAAGKIGMVMDQTANFPGVRPFSIERCKGLLEAVQEAAQIVEAGDVVLLSPGGTSFDEFRDFEERGEAFRKWVMSLK
jgi:UDP-N-acetylmuramoylalanine--D-glutamate ligase